MKNKEVASFSKDGFRALYCTFCKRYLGKQHLGEKYGRHYKCTNCKATIYLGAIEEHKESGETWVRVTQAIQTAI